MKGEKIFSGLELDFLELTLQEKLKLIKFFEFLLDEEISKPLGQMNSEAVDNYIKILLHLKGINIELSSDFINEQVRKIFHPEESAVPETAKTTKKHFNKRKIWLVAACISILVALFSVISFSSEKGVVDTLEEFFGTFEFIPFGKETDIGNETYGKEGKSKHYKALEDVLESEKIDILYPVYLPDEITVTDIIFSYKNNKQKIYFTFNDSDLYAEISYNTTLTEVTKDDTTETKEINGIQCYICEISDINTYQIEFLYNGNLYYFRHTEKEELIEIIKNLEEIKNEN